MLRQHQDNKHIQTKTEIKINIELQKKTGKVSLQNKYRVCFINMIECYSMTQRHFNHRNDSKEHHDELRSHMLYSFIYMKFYTKKLRT